MAEASPDTSAGGRRNKRPPALSEDETLAWIRLIRTDNVGPITFRELIAHFGSARAALEAIPELRKRGGVRRPGPVGSLTAAERELRAAQKCGARLLAFPNADYPTLLRHISDPPPLLYAMGDASLAARDVVAMVGSRNCSAAGRQFAAILARDLGQCGIVISSGLARGIDTAAHEAALGTGTIAVLAGGIDVVYPPENAKLHAAIASQGLVLSEAPPGLAARGQDFPRRNRIISGLSRGVVIVEAAQKSGSLITARMALEQNREVFAVPGYPLDPRALGTNGLIQSGAHLVISAQDIWSELTTGLRRPFELRETSHSVQDPPLHTAGPAEPAARDREALLQLLSLTPIHPDMLLRHTELDARRLSVALLELDLAGRIERHAGERISLRPDYTSDH